MGESYKDSPMVGVPGLEPGASWSRTKRATKLRYTPLFPIKSNGRLSVYLIFTPPSSLSCPASANFEKLHQNSLIASKRRGRFHRDPGPYGGRTPPRGRKVYFPFPRAAAVDGGPYSKDTVSSIGFLFPCSSAGAAVLAGYPNGSRQQGSMPSGREKASLTFCASK